jgi:hypothetical protein
MTAPDGGEDRPPGWRAPTSPYSRWGAPAPLSAAAGIAALQGVVTTLLAIADAVNVTGDRLVMGLTSSLFFAVYGVALVVSAWGMHRLLTWSRGPVLLAQLIWLGLAWSFRGSPTTVVAVVLAVSAVLVLAGLLHPASMAALNRPEHRSDDDGGS